MPDYLTADLTESKARQDGQKTGVNFASVLGLTERSYWIGGSDEALEGEWTWTDGTSVRMGTPTWGADGQSQHPTGGYDENCVGLDKDNFFFFNDFSCSSEISLICELKL